MVKKKDPSKEIHHTDGRVELLYTDGTSDFIDRATRLPVVSSPASINLDQFIKDLQLNPKDALIRQAVEGYLKKVGGIADDKTTAKDYLDMIAQLKGVTKDTSTGDRPPIAIQINIGNPQPHDADKKKIDVTARVVDEEV